MFVFPLVSLLNWVGFSTFLPSISIISSPTFKRLFSDFNNSEILRNLPCSLLLEKITFKSKGDGSFLFLNNSIILQTL
jgi:hypothetical protein